MQLGTLIDAEEEIPPIYTMINPTRKRIQVAGRWSLKKNGAKIGSKLQVPFG